MELRADLRDLPLCITSTCGFRIVSRSSLIKIVSVRRKRARSAKTQRNRASQTFRDERKNTGERTRERDISPRFSSKSLELKGRRISMEREDKHASDLRSSQCLTTWLNVIQHP